MKRLLKLVAVPAVMLVASLMTNPSSAQAGWGGYGYSSYGYRPAYNYSYNYFPRAYNYSYYSVPTYYGGYCY